MKRRTLLKTPGVGALSLPVCHSVYGAEKSNSAEAETRAFRRVPVNQQGVLEQIYVPAVEGRIPEVLTSGSKQDYHLSVLHINDLHHRLMSSHPQGDTFQMAQIAKQVADAREAAKENEVVLFVSAGDDHIGTEFDELLGSDAQSFELSAAYRALSAAGMDMSVIGNHEFDKQTEIAQLKIRNDARFPVLSANLTGSAFKDFFYPCAIGIAKGLRIGFIGLTTDEAIYTGTKTDPTLKVTNPETALLNSFSLLKDYVDAWVVISHLGYNGDLRGATERHLLKFGDMNVAGIMSELTSRPVMVVGGHTHTRLNQNGLEARNRLNNAIVLQAGAYGEFLGQASVSVNNGNIEKFQARLNPVYPGRDADRVQTEDDYDREFQAAFIAPLMATLKHRLKVVLGKTANNVAISPQATRIDRYIGESAIANFMNDAVVYQSRYFPSGEVDIAVFNATGIAGLPLDQDISYADIYRMMPYADNIVIVKMMGSQLRELIENNAKRIYLQEELTDFGGAENPSDFLERGFLHFSSKVRYCIKAGDNVALNKAVDITVDDDSQFDNREFTVAINSYLANGRGNWAGDEISLGLSEPVKGFSIQAIAKASGLDTGLIYRTELINYIQGHANGVITAETGAGYDQRLAIL